MGALSVASAGSLNHSSAWVGSSDNVNARIGLRSEKMTFEIFGTNIH